MVSDDQLVIAVEVVDQANDAGQLAIQPELQTVLFVAVNRVSEFHRNRMNVNNAVHSDGAVTESGA